MTLLLAVCLLVGCSHDLDRQTAGELLAARLDEVEKPREILAPLGEPVPTHIGMSWLKHYESDLRDQLARIAAPAEGALWVDLRGHPSQHPVRVDLDSLVGQSLIRVHGDVAIQDHRWRVYSLSDEARAAMKEITGGRFKGELGLPLCTTRVVFDQVTGIEQTTEQARRVTYRVVDRMERTAFAQGFPATLAELCPEGTGERHALFEYNGDGWRIADEDILR